jgi:hypothetical protein
MQRISAICDDVPIIFFQANDGRKQFARRLNEGHFSEIQPSGILWAQDEHETVRVAPYLNEVLGVLCVSCLPRRGMQEGKQFAVFVRVKKSVSRK